MFESLIVTLREGVEAALMVGIIVAFLRKQGAERYLGAVWAGIATATATSLLSAFFLYHAALNESLFEGILYVASAVLVATLLVWMWRHSHELSGEMKGALARILARESGRSVAVGLFLFSFLMIFREGIETVLFLSALSLTTTGLLSFLGAFLGLAAAVVFGVLFVRGSVRIDLARFFKITGIALLIFLAQLLLNGYHELSEAGWLPANETTMATIGPLVKNEIFFVLAVLALPLLMLLIPGRAAEAWRAEANAANIANAANAADAANTANAADLRLARAAGRRQGRARVLGATLGIAIVAVLGFGFVYAQPPAALSSATPVTVAGGVVRIPLSSFKGEKLERFVVQIDGHPVRFIAVPVDRQGHIATAFDACLICGPHGYYQEKGGIFCLHCGSVINPASVGRQGGCNPIPLNSRVEGRDLVLAASDLQAGVSTFAPAAAHRM